MKPKFRAFLYNFIGFVFIFLLVRFALAYFLPLHRIVLVLVAAFTASILAPKFGVVKEGDKEKIMMKWVFLKGVRQVK